MIKYIFLLFLVCSSQTGQSCSIGETDKNTVQYKIQLKKFVSYLKNKSIATMLVSVDQIIINENRPDLYLLKVHSGRGKPLKKTIKYWGSSGTDCRTNPSKNIKYVLYHLNNGHQMLYSSEEAKILEKNIKWEWFYGNDKSVIYYPKQLSDIRHEQKTTH